MEKNYTKELHNLYSSLTVINSRRMRQVVHVAHIGEKRNSYKNLVAKH
jgi:hypothetical protein